MTRQAAATDFDEFYRGSIARVTRVVQAMFGDTGLAQDCVQEAYIRAWQRWPQLVSNGDPTPWVRTVAVRLAISQYRRRRVELKVLTRLGPPADVPPPEAPEVDVTQLLRHLNLETRQTLALHYLADLSIEQIASELGVPTGTVKARLHRGRQQLATLLRETPDHETTRSTDPVKEDRR